MYKSEEYSHCNRMFVNIRIPYCAPEYVVRKTNNGKRGRPRKNKLVAKEES